MSAYSVLAVTLVLLLAYSSNTAEAQGCKQNGRGRWRQMMEISHKMRGWDRAHRAFPQGWDSQSMDDLLCKMEECEQMAGMDEMHHDSCAMLMGAKTFGIRLNQAMKMKRA